MPKPVCCCERIGEQNLSHARRGVHSIACSNQGTAIVGAGSAAHATAAVARATILRGLWEWQVSQGCDGKLQLCSCAGVQLCKGAANVCLAA